MSLFSHEMNDASGLFTNSGETKRDRQIAAGASGGKFKNIIDYSIRRRATLRPIFGEKNGVLYPGKYGIYIYQPKKYTEDYEI